QPEYRTAADHHRQPDEGGNDDHPDDEQQPGAMQECIERGQQESEPGEAVGHEDRRLTLPEVDGIDRHVYPLEASGGMALEQKSGRLKRKQDYGMTSDDHTHPEKPTQGLFLGGMAVAMVAFMLISAAIALIAAATHPAVL